MSSQNNFGAGVGIGSNGIHATGNFCKPGPMGTTVCGSAKIGTQGSHVTGTIHTPGPFGTTASGTAGVGTQGPIYTGQVRTNLPFLNHNQNNSNKIFRTLSQSN